MIYIDPPYNTGSDGFAYNDLKKFTKEELAELTGTSEEEAERILSFGQKGSASHSAWLAFMYPRLSLARDFLRDDGVIFISIDDNEVAELKLLCNEIFGEENFVETFIWHKKTAPNNVIVGNVHEYILMYAKNKNLMELSLLPRDSQKDKGYKNPDNDHRGRWKADNLTAAAKGGRAVPSLIYTITNPKTGRKHLPPEGRMWAVNSEEMQLKITEGTVYWGKNGDGRPMNKRFLSETRDGMVAPTILSNVGTNSSAGKYLNNLFNGKMVFETPKPVELIEHLAQIATKDRDIILDFFAGSGSTYDAILQMNSKNQDKRSFIGVQLGELTSKKSPAYKAGYRNIADITKDRIKKCEDLLIADGKLSEEGRCHIYKLVESSFKDKNKDLSLDGGAQNNLFATITDKSKLGAILTTWKLRDGYELSVPIETIRLADYEAYLCGNHLYFVNPDFSHKALLELVTRFGNDKEFQPRKLVVLDVNIDTALRLELDSALKGFKNKNSDATLDLIVRV